MRGNQEAPAQDVAGLGLVVPPGELAHFFLPYRPIVNVKYVQLGRRWLVLAQDIEIGHGLVLNQWAENLGFRHCGGCPAGFSSQACPGPFLERNFET